MLIHRTLWKLNKNNLYVMFNNLYLFILGLNGSYGGPLFHPSLSSLGSTPTTTTTTTVTSPVTSSPSRRSVTDSPFSTPKKRDDPPSLSPAMHDWNSISSRSSNKSDSEDRSGHGSDNAHKSHSSSSRTSHSTSKKSRGELTDYDSPLHGATAASHLNLFGADPFAASFPFGLPSPYPFASLPYSSALFGGVSNSSTQPLSTSSLFTTPVPPLFHTPSSTKESSSHSHKNNLKYNSDIVRTTSVTKTKPSTSVVSHPSSKERSNLQTSVISSAPKSPRNEGLSRRRAVGEAISDISSEISSRDDLSEDISDTEQMRHPDKSNSHNSVSIRE